MAMESDQFLWSSVFTSMLIMQVSNCCQKHPVDLVLAVPFVGRFLDNATKCFKLSIPRLFAVIYSLCLLAVGSHEFAGLCTAQFTYDECGARQRTNQRALPLGSASIWHRIADACYTSWWSDVNLRTLGIWYAARCNVWSNRRSVEPLSHLEMPVIGIDCITSHCIKNFWLRFTTKLLFNCGLHVKYIVMTNWNMIKSNGN